MKLRQLIEEYKDSIKVGKKTFEVYVNPNSKELARIIKDSEYDVRIIIDTKGKKLYAFNGELMHHHVTYEFGIPYAWEHTSGDGRYIFDVVNTVGNKLLKDKIIKEVIDKNPWLEKYFSEA